jgi:hypothetical protein
MDMPPVDVMKEQMLILKSGTAPTQLPALREVLSLALS